MSGTNEHGQMGRSPDDAYLIHYPITHIPFSKKIIRVCCGPTHTAIIDDEYILHLAGCNAFHKLGLQACVRTETFVALSLPSNGKVKDVGCGDNHTMIVTVDNRILALGSNVAAQLGLPKAETQVSVPTDVLLPPTCTGALFIIKLVRCHTYCTYILTASGLVLATGFKRSGEFGLGNSIPPYGFSPIKFQALLLLDVVKIVDIQCAKSYVVALDSVGRVWQSGDFMEQEFLWSPREIVVSRPSHKFSRVVITRTFGDEAKIIAIGSGEYHSVALASTNEIYGWGSNKYGALGEFHTASSIARRLCGPLGRPIITDVRCGGSETLLLTATSEIYAMGSRIPKGGWHQITHQPEALHKLELPFSLESSWDITTHHFYPTEIRAAVKCLLILALIDVSTGWPRHQNSGIAQLPRELLFKVIGYAVDNWWR